MMHFPLFPRSLRTLLVLASLAVANPFTDTFDANSLLGWTVVGQRSWSESNGLMQPADGSNSSGFLLRQGTFAADGDLEADVQGDQWNGQTGGVVFRYISPTNFLYVGVKPADQWNQHIYLCVDDLNSCSFIGNIGLLVQSAATVHVTMRGSDFTVLLNGSVVATFTNTTHATGTVGLAHTSQWNRYCSFEAVRWTEAQDGSSSTSTTPVSSSSTTPSPIVVKDTTDPLASLVAAYPFIPITPANASRPTDTSSTGTSYAIRSSAIAALPATWRSRSTTGILVSQRTSDGLQASRAMPPSSADTSVTLWRENLYQLARGRVNDSSFANPRDLYLKAFYLASNSGFKVIPLLVADLDYQSTPCFPMVDSTGAQMCPDSSAPFTQQRYVHIALPKSPLPFSKFALVYDPFFMVTNHSAAPGSIQVTMAGITQTLQLGQSIVVEIPSANLTRMVFTYTQGGQTFVNTFMVEVQ